MKKIKLNDAVYTPIIHTECVNGKDQVMWEIESGKVIGIRKSKFEGNWTEEELAESTLYKVKIFGDTFCIPQFEMDNPSQAEGFSFFLTKEEADDYAQLEISNQYYDGEIDIDECGKPFIPRLNAINGS